MGKIIWEKSVSKEDKAEILGKIVDQERGFFICETDIGQVMATISGKLRKNKIRLTVGDPVTIEVSAYDLERGRITKRL